MYRRTLTLAMFAMLAGTQLAQSTTARADAPVTDAQKAPPAKAADSEEKPKAAKPKGAVEIKWHDAFNMASAIHQVKLAGNPPEFKGTFTISANSIYCHERSMTIDPQSYCEITKGKAKGTLSGLAAVALMQILAAAKIGDDHGAGNTRYRIGAVQCTIEYGDEGGADGESYCYLSKK